MSPDATILALLDSLEAELLKAIKLESLQFDDRALHGALQNARAITAEIRTKIERPRRRTPPGVK